MTWSCLSGPVRLDTRREAFVHSLTFGRARLSVGPPGDLDLLDDWLYDTPEAAVAALDAWAACAGAGEPDGWMRHPRSGRRRPGGDPALEYVML